MAADNGRGPARIALIGDYDPAVTAHRAIPQALQLAARGLGIGIETEWVHSSRAGELTLQDYTGLWCVPLSPYADGEAVIATIAAARRQSLPFLGTCAGYQHAVIEFARHELGLSDAESSEDNPAAPTPVIHALACSLLDVGETILIEPGSRLHEIYGAERAEEAYHCRFGVNPDYLAAFEGSGFEFCCRDADGQPRAFALADHPFFIGTAYQPERAALAGKNHPLISAFLASAI